jgi:UDP-N-acetylglucosamine--N-acetylmuramyl-(pentapeptide) pyrophosphoryl-undecaprenol N-acetylglucosamine transferase
VKIVIAGGGTGGHLMPALVLAEALRDARPDAEVVLVGAARGVEAHVLPRYPFRHYLLPIEPLYRHTWWRNVRWPAVAWRVWHAVGRVLAEERPAVVIGTGGYAAGPLVWRAQRLGVPTVLQEQNAYPGLTTRWLARRARQIHLGFPEAAARLRPGPHTAVFAPGNPIREPAGERDRAGALTAFALSPERSTVLVFGGSQGARALNYAVASALEHGGLTEVNLLWGTGTAHAATYERYAVPGRVVVQGFFDPITAAYRAADVVVSRSGAMTTAELCAWGKASVLVPLPTAAADHQLHNARALAAAGAAVVLEEADFSGRALAHAVGELIGDPLRRAALGTAAHARSHPEAARAIVSNILTLVGH